MRKVLLYDAHPSRQLVFTGLVIVGSWIVFQLIGMLSGMFIFGLSFSEISDSLAQLNDPAIVGFLKYVQAFTSTGMFIFAAWAVAWYIDPDWKQFLGLKTNPGWLVIILACAFIFVILPFTNLLSYFNSNLGLPAFLSGVENFFRDKESQMTEIMEGFLKPGAIGGLAFNLLVIAVIPAIGEELMFRGVVQKLLAKWFGHPHWAILLTAFLFSAMHLQFLSFLPRFFLGIVLGYLFYWSGSVWLVILVHFINNALAVVFYFYHYGGYISNYLENAGTPENGLLLAFAGAFAGFALLYLVYRKLNMMKRFS